MRLRARIAIALGLIALSLLKVETQPYRSVVDWSARIADADHGENGLTYRLYDQPRELRVSLAMANRSGADLIFDEARLRERVTFSMAGEKETPIVATWPSETGSRRFQWTVTLARKDGQPFAVGRYSLAVSVRAAYEVMRSTDGKSFRGVEHQSVNLFVNIQPPANAREKSAALRLLAKRTFAEDTSEGLRLYVLAAEANPDDPGALLDLGVAYVKTKRCHDAVSIFQRARPLERKSLGQGSGSILPSLLAHALVCVGDEEAASQVLRDAGQPEDRITDTIQRFRKTVPK